jgi:hypothetical protein
VKPNPKLQPFEALIGSWSLVGSHPQIPNTTLHGRATFEWIEGGAFCRMHMEIDEPQIPTGIAIFGSDDEGPRFYMIYFDERGVSRKFDVTLRDDGCEWTRMAPGFSQRFSISVASDGRRMEGKGILSKDGRSWESDLQLTYTRA